MRDSHGHELQFQVKEGLKQRSCVVSASVVWDKGKTGINSEVAKSDKRSRGIEMEQQWGIG